MGLNKIMLIGNLGADPEVRQTNGGQSVCNFRMAVTEKYSSGGQSQDRTDWFNVSVWGNAGEACGRFLSKGRQVYVEGRINKRSYTDKDGNERDSWDVTAFKVEFLGGGSGDGGQGGGGNGGGYGGNRGGDNGGGGNRDGYGGGGGGNQGGGNNWGQGNQGGQNNQGGGGNGGGFGDDPIPF